MQLPRSIYARLADAALDTGHQRAGAGAMAPSQPRPFTLPGRRYSIASQPVVSASAAVGATVSTAPFSRAMRPILERFRSRITLASSSGDFFYHAIVTACIGARRCLRSKLICTPRSESPLTSSNAGSMTNLWKSGPNL
jgi:hypothetical protein